MTSAVTNGIGALPCTLDLLGHSLRALGEWQTLQGLQPRLLGASKKTFEEVLSFVPRLQLVMEPQLSPPDGIVSYSTAQQEVIKSTVLDVIRIYEFFGCDTAPPITQAGVFITTRLSNIETIQNWKTFIDTKLTQERAFLSNKMQDAEMQDVDNCTKESWYWAARTRYKACAIVPAILDSAKAMNCQEWLLPNGIKVGLNDVRAITLEVIPNEIFLFQVEKYYQTGGTILLGDRIIPAAQLDMDAFKKAPFLPIYRQRILPEGITRIHHVIEVTLPDEAGTYIVDPTSMQFNYRGPNGTLIAHGTWEKYKEHFPGKIIQCLVKPTYPEINLGHKTLRLKTSIEEMYYLGGGPCNYATRLAENITTYKDQRHCGYCGWIEGSHPVRPKAMCRYELKAVLLMNCGKCKAVGYCDKQCQKAHWKAHKQICGKGPDTQ